MKLPQLETPTLLFLDVAREGVFIMSLATVVRFVKQQHQELVINADS